jgi:predicted O-methyltransferase YrrM
MNFEKWPHFSRGFKDVSEAKCIYDFCISRRPQLILEIGRRMGVSTRLFAMAAKEWDGQVISVDGAPNPYVPKILNEMGLTHFVTLIDKWSPWIEPDPDWEIELLYIDGDHTYIATLVDYHYFNFFVPAGGLIAFHDCLHKPVKAAIDAAARRDRLKHLETIGNLAVFLKTDQRRRRVYYQFPNVEFKTI